jgi:hypothetical protein
MLTFLDSVGYVSKGMYVAENQYLNWKQKENAYVFQECNSRQVSVCKRSCGVRDKAHMKQVWQLLYPLPTLAEEPRFSAQQLLLPKRCDQCKPSYNTNMLLRYM